MNKRRVTILSALALMLAALLLIGYLAWPDRLHAKPRRQWKDQAIARIEQRLRDPQALAAEVQRLASAAAERPQGWRAWVGEEILVMQNGDWIVCQSISSKQDQRIHDLFIGHGSDGRWYYSTFHFCSDRVTLWDEPQPQSLAEFIDAFWLTEFDGRSDECLRETWVFGQPWGLEKLHFATRINR